jgi:hypothetical protein
MEARGGDDQGLDWGIEKLGIEKLGNWELRNWEI